MSDAPWWASDGLILSGALLVAVAVARLSLSPADRSASGRRPVYTEAEFHAAVRFMSIACLAAGIVIGRHIG